MLACDLASALGDPVRLRILEILHRAPSRVHEIAANFPISRPAISRHLRILRRCRLVDLRPKGRETVYSLVPEALAPLEEVVRDLRSASNPSAGESASRPGAGTRPGPGPVTRQPSPGTPQVGSTPTSTPATAPPGESVAAGDRSEGGTAPQTRPRTAVRGRVPSPADWRAW